jgi:PAS domain S-box-containing protein
VQTEHPGAQRTRLFGRIRSSALLSLPNHSVTLLLHESAETCVYRGVARADNAAVILKTPADPAPDAQALARLRHEYAVLSDIACAGVPTALGLHPHQGSLVLVHEDIGGEPLDTLIGDQPIELEAFFAIAVSIAEALVCTHRLRIVHRDIKPQNIVVNVSTGQVQLIDFGLSSRLTREHAQLQPPERLEGTLSYLAPEQTGRMNRAVDCRADFYSLGATFYELLTGHTPFAAQDPLELVHCHLARAPQPPTAWRPELPQVLSDIVLKLLSKLAEDRYQSAGGLLADLLECQRQWRATGTITAFALGAADSSDRFELPQRLYGRETEMQTLLDSYARLRATGRPELVLIAGYSGIGKSALVAELHKPMTAHHGFFASGKFDPYRRGVPYATLAQAMQSLVQQLLAQSAERLRGWRRRINEALGEQGQMMVDMVPQLQFIIGPQPPLEVLPPEVVLVRLRRAFRAFVGVFAQAEHPLVLFLDDLQWVDVASLDLLRHVCVHPQSRWLLVLGAYRDNEVGASHPLSLALGDLRRRGMEPRTITLAPLAPEHVCSIVAGTLHCSETEAAPVARLVFDKTRGNPFFCGQFLSTLHLDGLITFDEPARRWRCNLADIEARNFTDNVVALMLGELQRLPRATQQVLASAGFLGHQFELATLALVAGSTPAITLERLWPALQVGLMIHHAGRCRFLHDRVQEAAYLLTPQAQQPALHARIGNLLLQATPAQALDEQVFAIVAQLNAGASAIVDAAERRRLVELNQRAAGKAHAASQYSASAGFLASAIALLQAEHGADAMWRDDYPLAWALHLGRAEAELLAGQGDDAEPVLDELVERAATALDRAEARRILARLALTRNHNVLACQIVRTGLLELGLTLPQHPARADVQAAYERIRALLAGRPIEAVLTLPPITDARARAAIRLLSAVSIAAYITDQDRWALQVCEMAALCLRHGNDDSSATVYGVFGYMLAGYLNEYAEGYRFVQVARVMQERAPNQHQRCTVLMHQGFVTAWVRPLAEALDLFRRAVPEAIENGNVVTACITQRLVATTLLFDGRPLPEVLVELDRGVILALESNFPLWVDMLLALRRGLHAVAGTAGVPPLIVNGKVLDGGDDGIDHLADTGNPWVDCRRRLAVLTAACINGDFAQARAAAFTARQTLWSAAGLLLVHEYHFGAALALAGLHTGTSAAAPAVLDELREHLAPLASWAGLQADTFGPALELVQAELARLDGRPLEAMRGYDRAASAARQRAQLHREALAHEFAARFYQAHGADDTALHHLRNARDAYLRWGAHAKVAQLDQHQPVLRRLAARSSSEGTATIPPLSRLDAIAIVQASHAISGQIERDTLLRTLMKIVLEQAGGESAALLLAEGGKLALTATAHVDAQQIQVQLIADGAADTTAAATATSTSPSLPQSMISYAQHTREPVLLHDTRGPHRYSGDPHFASATAGSALALPILRQGALVGVLYVEHRVSNVFVPTQLEVLELIAAQAAISLENAKLYAALERHSHALEGAVDSRTAELQRSRNVLQAILDSAPALISLKDLDGHYLLYNRQYALHFTGRERALQGLSIADLVDDEVAKRSRAHDLQVIHTQRPLRNEQLLPSANGPPRMFQVHKFPVLDADGRVYAVGTIAVDVSDLKDAQIAAEAATHTKSQFLANMSHEIRTPMNAILGMSHLALRSGLNPQQHNYVQKVERSAQSLLGLINDILDFSKIEAGKLDMERLDFELADVFDNLANLMAQQAEGKGLELVFELPPDLPGALVGDPLRLGQVLINLCSNAV